MIKRNVVTKLLTAIIVILMLALIFLSLKKDAVLIKSIIPNYNDIDSIKVIFNSVKNTTHEILISEKGKSSFLSFIAYAPETETKVNFIEFCEGYYTINLYYRNKQLIIDYKSPHYFNTRINNKERYFYTKSDFYFFYLRPKFLGLRF